MMKLLILLNLIFLGAISACAPAPTATPDTGVTVTRVVFATPTATTTLPKAVVIAVTTTATVANVPTETATRMLTSTPTETLTPVTISPTRANTVTPESTPTRVYPAEWDNPPDGVVYFESDLVNLARIMFPEHVDKKRGADFETGNFEGFGPGLRAYPKGQPVQEPNGEILRRGYPTFYPWNLPGGFGVAMTIKVVTDKTQSADGINQKDRWFGVLSAYGWRKGEDPATAAASYILGSVILPFGDKYRVSLHIIDISGVGA